MVDLLEDLNEGEQLRLMREGRVRAFQLVTADRDEIEGLARTLFDKKRSVAD